MRFYLGSHHPDWLGKTDVPLFISRRRLMNRMTFPRALNGWALDSGGFTELSMHGAWTVTPEAYVADVRKFSDEIGQLEWAAPQDWMCEPMMLAKTGKTVAEHQLLTVQNYLTLKSLAPEMPFIPVLQGWEPSDYHRHVEMYSRAGVCLEREPVVGVGSVCRRQNMSEAAQIIRSLYPLRLHGFGFKVTGLRNVGLLLHSADSMAWSFSARRNPAIAGHTHKNCANCMEYALDWRERMLGLEAVSG